MEEMAVSKYKEPTMTKRIEVLKKPSKKIQKESGSEAMVCEVVRLSKIRFSKKKNTKTSK